MSIQRTRLTAIALFVLALAVPGPAEAQEWKIYTRGKTAPIVSNFYAEEAPWVFYRDDDSMYVFAIGCNQIVKIERGGTEIPLPACPVEKVPTNTTRVLINILELEAKRLDEAFERLRGITVQFNNAAANATIAAANAKVAGLDIPKESLQETLETLKVQLDDVRFDLRQSLDRTDAIVGAVSAYREMERRAIGRSRYFFAPR